MERVRRWDFGTVGLVERTDQGYLRAPANITKTGVFTYRQPNGVTRRELRLPDEVFSPESLKSFGLAPLTNNHPPELLNSRNTARYQVGTVVEPRQDGNFVAATIQITDEDAIAEAEAGKRFLSCGYNCDLQMESGITAGIPGIPDGLSYEAIQRNIRGNHVAIVSKGRAGPDVQLRLDSQDGFQMGPDSQRNDADGASGDFANGLLFDKKAFSLADATKWMADNGYVESDYRQEAVPSRGEELAPGVVSVAATENQDWWWFTETGRRRHKAELAKRKKRADEDNTQQGSADGRPRETRIMSESSIRIDGVSFDVTSQVAEAVGKLTARLDEVEAKLAEATKKSSEQQARADAAEESLAAEKKARADALSPEKVQAAVQARLALERVAGPILGDDVKLDGMSDGEIRRSVVLATATDAEVTTKRLDAGDESYLMARYDAALEAHASTEQRNDGMAAVRAAGNQTSRVDNADAARKRMIAHNQEVGRKALRTAS